MNFGNMRSTHSSGFLKPINPSKLVSKNLDECPLEVNPNMWKKEGWALYQEGALAKKYEKLR